MKKWICGLLILLLALSACGCNQFSEVSLDDTMEVPADGIISAETVQKIKDDNAIAVFHGESGDYSYEWTIFGSDITEPKEINLALEIEAAGADAIGVTFGSQESFGFPALLSVTLQELWDAQGAAVYRMEGQNQTALCSATISGSEASTLSFSVTEAVGRCVIRPEAAMQAQPGETAIGTGAETAGETGSDNRTYSDGSETGQDEYATDPVPEGKPLPVEPDDQQVDSSKSYTCTFSIECTTILNNLANLNEEKLSLVPSDGIILPTQTVTFYEGESVFDVLQRICKENNIHMESSWTPIYNSAYIEGIHNLYEFDCGELSGWMYRVNGWYPNYGCSRYQLAQGDVVEWRFTCDLGRDIGGGNFLE